MVSYKFFEQLVVIYVRFWCEMDLVPRLMLC
jgi:hypothetical protein